MLSKTTEYALRAAVCLAQPPVGTHSSQVIAEQTQVPRKYLHKVIQDLVFAGLVHSQPGPRGGYTLALPADEVTMLDVINAVNPIVRITSCPLGRPDHATLCPLHQELDNAYATIQTALGKVTLSQMVDPKNHLAPLCDVTVEQSLVAAVVATRTDKPNPPRRVAKKV